VKTSKSQGSMVLPPRKLMSKSITISFFRFIKTNRKIRKLAKAVEFFSVRNWRYSDGNVVSLWNSLTSEDREIFPFDIEDLDWEAFCQVHVLGIKYHMAKEGLDTIPEALTKHRR